MTTPFAYYCSIFDGIYYTPNFTLSGAISWNAVTNVGLFDDVHDCFAVDPFDPLNRQYVFCTGAAYGGALTPREVYTRNGGNWTKILDVQQAETITGVTVVSSVGHLQCIWCDPTVKGSVYVGFYTGRASDYVLKSTDYGANWTDVEVASFGSALWEFQVYGNSYWVHNGIDTLMHSPNGGANWYFAAAPGNRTTSGVCVNPLDTTEAYMAVYGTYDLEYHKYAAGAVTKATKQAGSLLANGVAAGNVGTMHMMWIDPADVSHHRIVKSDGKLYHTHDKWANITETNISCGTPSHLTYIHGGTGTEADIVIVASYSLGQVLIYDDENDTTGVDRSGVGGAAIAGTPSRFGLWVGYAPADTGIYLFSVEEGDITNIPDADNLGLPLFGDRSSWRDFDADDDGNGTPLADYHAQDIKEDTPQRHNPWPASSGQAPVSDGAKYIATDILTQAEFDYSFYLPAGHSHYHTVTIVTTGTYTLGSTYDTIICNCIGGAITLNLPTAASSTGRLYIIKKIDSSANAVTIDPNGGETIDDSGTLIIDSQYSSAQIVCDGSEWWIV